MQSHSHRYYKLAGKQEKTVSFELLALKT